MAKLYSLQIKILNKLERFEEGKVLADLIAAIIKEQQWRIKDNYARMFKHYAIDIETLDRPEKYLRKAQKFWVDERYKDIPKVSGKIVFVHNNEKFGKIEDSQGRTVGFHRKHFTSRHKSTAKLNGSMVEFYAMPSFDGSMVAENIVITSPPKKTTEHENVGKVFLGSVKNVVDFGIFVRIEGCSDGLLHKSKIPSDIKDTFHELFKPGDNIKVEVIAITEKGMQLKLLH
jgi:polyribonucleotide nucleotidyltransferase